MNIYASNLSMTVISKSYKSIPVGRESIYWAIASLRNKEKPAVYRWLSHRRGDQ